MRNLLLIVTFVTFISACSNQQTNTQKNEHLQTILHDYWEERMQLFPLEATAAGDNRYNNQLPVTISQSYREKLTRFYSSYLKRLQSLSGKQTNEDKENIEVLQYELQNNLNALAFPSHLMPINQFWSFTLEFPQLGSGKGNHPFKTTKDYADFLDRMSQFDVWVDTAIANMREGMNKGYTLPKVLAKKVVPQLENIVKPDAKSTIFYGPILNFPSAFSKEDQLRFSSAYTSQIDNSVLPAYQKLITFLNTEYIPACRETHGYSAFKNGKEWYQQLIQQYTTTNLSPDSIYQLGLQEVSNITAEMEKVKTKVGFNGSLQQFFDFINKDPQFFPFSTASQILDSFKAMQAIQQQHLSTLFETFPKTPFEIRQTEAYRAASASAEYNQGSEDGSRPGIFYVPILNPKTFNAVGMETLFLHEAIPGHHFQISLQQENKTLPTFRKFLFYSAYGEGWALYTETLGEVLGLFKNPYQYFGHLSDAMHRAIRLVVDAGIHTRNMTREEAITYMKAHERISDEEATAEIERYMAIPGQALSYKIGQITLMRLRDKYNKQLGEKFNIKAFHTEVLNGGNLPLDVLEKKLDRWANAH
jgi:uncharacterized protein (DUF885 family)